MNDRTTDPDTDEPRVASPGSEPTIKLLHQSDTFPVLNLPPGTMSASPQRMADSTKSLQFDSREPYPQRFGAYELLGELARGGMGVVFKARQVELDRTVALKMILGIQEDQAAKRFVQEARATATMDHPNIVPIYDVGNFEGRLFFTMPFVDGPSLKALVESSGVPPVSKALSLFVQIVAGMAHAHRRGIVHRDLKPANVLVDSDGRPRVADFGLAKKYDDAARHELTGTGQIMGTPAYMSPEQAQDSKDVTPASDVYSLGAILYFLLTGRAPFTGTNITELLIQVVTTTPASPRTLNPSIPAELEAICLRCLAKSPTDRFPHAMAVAEKLSPIVQKYELSSNSLDSTNLYLADSASENQLSITSLDPPPSPSRKKLFVIAAFGLVALIGAVAFFWPPSARKDATKTTEDPTDPGTDRSAVIAPKVDDALWPAPKGDFKVSVDFNASVQKGTDGIVRLANNAPIQLELLSEVDAWVYVFIVDPSDQAILLYPYPQEPDGRLIGGVKKLVPSHPDVVARTTPTAGDGFERIRVVASTAKLPDLPAGKPVGNFRAFVDQIQRAGLQKVLRQVRGNRGIEFVQKSATAPPTIAQLSEAELRFRVEK